MSIFEDSVGKEENFAFLIPKNYHYEARRSLFKPSKNNVDLMDYSSRFKYRRPCL